MQCCLDTIDDQGVTRVVSTLEPHHALRAFGQPVNQLAFALVTPLGPDDDNVTSFCCIHGMILR
jgi:hypothetical protein